MSQTAGKILVVRLQAALLVSLIGCAPGSDISTAEPLAAPAQTTSVGGDETSWFDSKALRRDLGVVVGPDRTNLSHTYRVTNTSQNSVRVLALRNERPCCGEIEAAVPALLAPGQTLDVRVTLHAARSSGKLQHLALVEAEFPAVSAEILTTAAFVPRSTIEEVGDSRRALLPSESGTLRFVVRCFGTKEHPPVSLDGVSLGGDGEADWSGGATLEEGTDGLIATRREGTLAIEASGAPGARTSEIIVNAGREELARHRVSWEVSPAIKAIPAGLIVSSGDHSPHKVLLRSADGRPFRVLSARSEPDGLRVTGAKEESLAQHVLQIGPGPDAHIDIASTADVIVGTDHPRQAEVRITVFISPKAATETKEETP